MNIFKSVTTSISRKEPNKPEPEVRTHKQNADNSNNMFRSDNGRKKFSNDEYNDIFNNHKFSGDYGNLD